VTVGGPLPGHSPDEGPQGPGSALLRRATVVVEDVATALREADDVVLTIDEGALTAADLVPVRDIVTGAVILPAGRRLVFKSVGMSGQDLVVAEAVARTAAPKRP
jgi:ornithine cyclodeaminase/alanine dehydrogenase-like protein (mu-crystallin family)